VTAILIAFAAFAQTVVPGAPPTPVAPPTAAELAEAAQEAHFETCSSMVRVDAQRAVDTANAWRLEGGGLYARQCLGLAYVAMERWAEAATVYEEAARDADIIHDARRADLSRRADLWVQAGNAWLAGGEPTRAILALDAALETPDLTDELRGEVHIDRARAMVALDNATGGRADLDRALALVPSDPMGWYLSAALARRQGDLVRARTDIVRAMELAPDNPDIVLMGGTIAGLAGDMTEAERLYRRVAEGAADTAAGRAARESLATLREVEVPAPAASPAAPPAPTSQTAPAPPPPPRR
jgi:tetratricopeptide (TPR) repeat protein